MLKTTLAFANPADAAHHSPAATSFSTEKEFARLTAEWPMARLAEIWNSFAGVVPLDNLKPVKKFTDRGTAVRRIWKAAQVLTPAPRKEGCPAPQAGATGTNKASARNETSAASETHRPRGN